MEKAVFNALLEHADKHAIKHKTYIDKLVIYFDLRVPQANIEKLKSLSVKNILNIKPLKCFPHLDRRLELHQLDQTALDLLLETCSLKSDYRMNYIELALDFYALKTEKLFNLRRFFYKHMVNAKSKTSNTPFYFCPSQADKTVFESTHELYYDPGIETATHYHYPKKEKFRFALYSGDNSFRWDKRYGCIHLEYRHADMDKLERLGIFTINDLIKFDHDRYWQEQLDLRHPRLKELGELFSQGTSATSFNKNGNKFFNKLTSLQAYLSINPDAADLFTPMTTVNCLHKYCKL